VESNVLDDSIHIDRKLRTTLKMCAPAIRARLHDSGGDRFKCLDVRQSSEWHSAGPMNSRVHGGRIKSNADLA
jgi:hypothetical protein